MQRFTCFTRVFNKSIFIIMVTALTLLLTNTASASADLIPPDVLIDSGPLLSTNLSDATFEFHAIDNVTASENLKFWCDLDGNGWENCSSNPGLWSYTGLPEGTHTFSLDAVDEAGNRLDPNFVEYTWVIDLTSPATPVVNAPSSFTNDLTPTILGTAEADTWINVWYFDDLGSPIQICENVQATGSGNWSCVSLETLPQREIELVINATDDAGNASSDTSYFFTVDLTAPVVPTMDAQGSSTNNSTPAISGTAEPGSWVNVWYFDDLGNPIQICQDVLVDGLGDWSCVSSAALPERDIDLVLNATDAAGNMSSDTSGFIAVDLTVPDTQISSRPANPSSSPDATFAFTSTDATAIFECKLDSASFAACTGPQTQKYTGLASGSHTFSVRAKDTAGNLDATPASYTWTINTLPVVPGAATLTSPIGNIGTNYTPTFTWDTVYGATWYYLWVNGPSGNVFKFWYTSALANCSDTTCSVTPAGLLLGAGNYTWWIQTWSSAGTGPWSSSMSFTTSLAGTATLVSPQDTLGTNYNPTYTWNEVPGATWYYLWVNGPSGNVVKQWYSSAQANCNGSTCSVTPTTTLAGGTHIWWIQTWNSAGTGPWSAGMTFSITPLAAATLTAPTSTIGTHTPTYVWDDVPGATWYYLWINGPSGNLFKQWYTSAQANCNGTTCSVTPALTLSAGTHTWWIETWNSAGTGPWSAGMTFTAQ